eukprot:11224052-Lingulodinium_polyedra.AAC.1
MHRRSLEPAAPLLMWAQRQPGALPPPLPLPSASHRQARSCRPSACRPPCRPALEFYRADGQCEAGPSQLPCELLE